ncbi:SO_0444 family Cu/Zn efflux transporter [Thalassotalea sp. G2M2-11]|uniref:SO_0444 family Cu/Zn efflux transporter n=1 Tax=Thalassotalea sp. G2M2-11 TaxID=2787627 RepID=UPI0019CF8A61
MDIFSQLFVNFIELSSEAAPWLLLGLIIAGLMKAWVPTKLLSHHLGQGKVAIVKAAIIGAPLPLCSCGVIPVATELRRSGASVPATSSFLVATPETGVDSVSVSYALLGPIMAIYRPITAILSAIMTGLFVSGASEPDKQPSMSSRSCCASENKQTTTNTNCCGSQSTPNQPSVISKTLSGLRYAATQLIDDLVIWLSIGLVFATLVRTFVPETFLLNYGSGLPAMLLMIAISIPMYICATASTPVAAGLILSGISPGTALVFMMAGPATNISTLGVIKNEMGIHVLWRYLLGISSCAVGFGLLLDWILSHFSINFTQQMQHSHEILPFWFSLFCLSLLIFLALKPLRKFIIKPHH